MEWLMFNPHIHGMFASLGSHVGESFVVSQDCLSTLDEILKRLSIEDRTLRTFRRAIGFAQVIKKDLLPLLINVRDDRKITDTTIKILVNLTMPVECLLPIEVMNKSEAGRNTIHELNWLLNSCKEAFLDSRATKRIVDHLKHTLDKGDKMSVEDSESLNNCIVLLRNVLHIPGPSTTQNQIMWNLFAHNIDKVLIEMMSGQMASEWGVGMVQLIALLYKDQHVATLQKLLNLWFEATLSESSEDNESNTSPPERGSGDSSSSMMTSDPTSDSSDNGDKADFKKGTKECGGKKKPLPPQSPLRSSKQNIKLSSKEPQSQKQGISGTSYQRDTIVKMECGGSSELSDCGYGTQNQESISTSSNEDDIPNRGKPVHTKPSNLMQKSRYQSLGGKVLTSQEKEDNRRKKLVKRSRTNRMNMKALLHHCPSEEDVSHLLKEFTVDFLLKGYGALVAELRTQLTSTQASLDTSHFFWLVTYFLKFATQLELDLEHISSVLSFEVVSYLTFEGVNLCEQFEMGKAQAGDITPCLRRMHLVVTAIRELVQAVDTYKKAAHLNKEDLNHLEKLQKEICETEELRCLFVLLLRQFTPTLQSRQYLQDVVVTNHILLTFIESSLPTKFGEILHNHLKQFVSVDIMRQYGLLLECFEENGQFVNDCVFTMMHHVAGDLDRVSALFQPPILKTFSLIWESEFQICDDWSDLIEYVIHKFINLPRAPTAIITEEEPPEPPQPPTLQTAKPPSWSQEECDSLYWYYVQSANVGDPVGAILRLYTESGVTNKTRIGVIEQLLEQDVITRMQYNELMEKEPIATMTRPQVSQQVKKENLDEVEILKEHLMKEGKSHLVCWLQKSLLEACHARLNKGKSPKIFVEPVAYYSTILEEPIPMVTWNCEEAAAMSYQPFVLLLHKLGLHLPAGAGKVYARIPHFWTPSALYALATKIGPVQADWVKFDPSEFAGGELKENMVQEEYLNGRGLEFGNHPFTTPCGPHHAPAYIPYTPEPNVGRNWLDLTRKSKVTTTQAVRDLDLSTMTVSDEESTSQAFKRNLPNYFCTT